MWAWLGRSHHHQLQLWRHRSSGSACSSQATAASAVARNSRCCDSPGSVETESSSGGQSVEKKVPSFQNTFFDDEDKRKLKRKKEDLEKKFCPRGSICEPPPKPLSESVGDALYDTWLALKKIPSYWSSAAESLATSICRFIKGDR